MYSNVPITETRHILNDTMEFKLIDPHINQQLLTCHDTDTKQNYFINKNNITIQNDGLAMRVPSSAFYQRFSYNI
jgi:hypothetical protein